MGFRPLGLCSGAVGRRYFAGRAQWARPDDDHVTLASSDNAVRRLYR